MFVNRKVVPSYLSSTPMGYGSDTATHQNTVQLLVGEVKEIIEPDSPRSLTKLYKEYTVDVQHREGGGPITTVTFPHCLVANAFGGTADKFVYTLRADSQTPDGKKVTAGGSKVLLLCVAGSTAQAFIVGGVREDQVKDETGHNMFFEFNGVSFAVNAEGEAKVQFKGATKPDGSLSGADNGPTTVDITKDGSFKVYTKESEQFIEIDHTGKKVEVHAKKGLYSADNELEFTAGSTMKASATGQMSLSSSTAGLDISVLTNVKVQSAGVLFGLATDNMMKGTTYRLQESIMNAKLATYFTGLAALATAAGTSLNAASQAMKVPVAGAIAAGAGPIQAAAVALTNMVQILAQMAAAIGVFEGASATYLSLQHKLD